MTITLADFGETVVPRVLQAWPAKGFERDWNEFNQRIAFKLLSPFRLDQILAAIENYRYENPDARAPEFKAIAARLWNIKRGPDAKKIAELNFREMAFAWARNKSDDDLHHFRYVAAEWYSQKIPKFWPVVEASELRSPISVICCWSMDVERVLTFEQGSDEWQELYVEYDIQDRARESARIGDWMAYKRKVDAPKQPIKTVVATVKALPAPLAILASGEPDFPSDDIPF